MRSVIEVKNIEKSFPLAGERVRVLKGISLTIEEGDFVAIMGPSGSGKSTLMNILGLLDGFDSGSFRLDGKEIQGLTAAELAEARRSKLGFVFQQFNLLPRMSAAENVALPLLYSLRAVPLEPAQEILRRVGLGDRLEHRPNQLSGGQQQRVAIARALINKPKVILADEPTGNLDSASSTEILKLLHELNREGMTIILVTHEADVAREANRVISIRDGLISSDVRTKTPLHAACENPHPHEQFRGRYAYFELFRQAFLTLFANPLRTFLSTLGVLIGVGAVIAMLAVGNGATESIQAQLASLGSNLLNVRSSNVKVGGVVGSAARLRLTKEDGDVISSTVRQVKIVSSFVQEGGKYVTYQNKNWSTTIYGVIPEFLEMHASLPEQGRIFTNDENTSRALVALVGLTVTRELFGTKNPIGQMLKINKIPFEVIGILPEKGGSGPMDQDDRIIVPLNTAMYRILGQTFVDAIEVEMEKGADLERAQAEITRTLRARHNIPASMQDEPFRIFNMAELQQALSETTKTLSILLLSVAGISLLVGGIGIMNIMLVSVTERTREIGLRKALGATGNDILIQFLIESASIGVFGGTLGVAFGLFASYLVKTIGGWATSVSVMSIVAAFLFASFVGMFFGIWPAKRAAALNPIDALRGE